MTVPGASSRFLYYFSGANNLGVNLSGTPGQVGEFHPSAVEETVQDLAGSFDTAPVVRQVGHEKWGDLTIPIWADETLQELLDDLMGVTASDRTDLQLFAYGWTGGDVIGQRCEMVQGYIAKVEPKTPPAALTQLNVTVRPTGKVALGHVVHALGAETADGDTEASSIDNAASSSDGGVGLFGYTTYTADGATGLAPRIIDSADNVSFGALIAFTTVTATTGGGERATVSGTIERYVACDWDYQGTPGAGTTGTFFMGFQRL